MAAPRRGRPVHCERLIHWGLGSARTSHQLLVAPDLLGPGGVGDQERRDLEVAGAPESCRDADRTGVGRRLTRRPDDHAQAAVALRQVVEGHTALRRVAVAGADAPVAGVDRGRTASGGGVDRDVERARVLALRDVV